MLAILLIESTIRRMVTQINGFLAILLNQQENATRLVKCTIKKSGAVGSIAEDG
jgi:hypothetical protein